MARTDPATTEYIPALRFAWLTRFFDPILRALLKEDRFRARLIAQADVQPGQRVLDVGCGTGTLAVMLKQAVPSAEVIGLDGDHAILEIARQKAAQAGASLSLVHGMAYSPPFSAGSFDCVVSSLVFHHLTTENKRRTLAALHALLRPGGTIHVADWGKAQNPLMRVAFLPVQLLDGFSVTADSVAGRLVPLMREAGFADARETHHEMTLLGTLALYSATRR